MKRHKEFLGNGLEFAPLRLLGGFICLDTHVGCSGCRYCLNRRHPALDYILNTGFHLDLEEVGVTPADLIDALESMPSFCKARVPIRFGHLTDWNYEQEGVEELLDHLPKDYPVVLMTRYPLSDRQLDVADRHDNVIVHATLTPLIQGFDNEYIAPKTVVDSARPLAGNKVFFMLRPLLADNMDENLKTLMLLPEEANAAFVRLSTLGIRSASGLTSISETDTDTLSNAAEDLGLRVWDYFGCLLRKNLRIQFFKYRKAATRPASACFRCPNRIVCEAAPPPDEAHLERELAGLGLQVNYIEWRSDMLHIEMDMPVARAEEVYLSELFGWEIQCSTVKRADWSGMHLLDAGILRRWKQSNFYPVEIMKDISIRILSKSGWAEV